MATHAVETAQGWTPTSPCTPDCLPPRPPGARLRTARRLAAMVAVFALAVGTAPVLPRRLLGRWISVLARVFLRVAGVRLVVRGATGSTFASAPRELAASGVLVVANHLSWLDVVALNAVAPVRLLAKAEVAQWPVIGRLAVRTGALFVDRTGLHALPGTVAETATALRSGGFVGVFPEATTWCGVAAGRFHRAAFQAAIDAAVPVRPVAVALRTLDGAHATGATFVGEQTLLDSMRRIVAMPGLVCELTMLPLIPVDVDGDRRALAARAAEAVGAVTGVPHGAAVPRPSVPLAA